MKTLRTLAFASLAVSVGLSAFVVACGDDTSIIITTDDGGSDGATADTGVDTGVDTGTEPGVDAGVDTGIPVEAGLIDARPDVAVPETVKEFETRVNSALCGSLTRCCFDEPTVADGGAVDGGTFNGKKCEDLYRDIGFEFSSTGTKLVDGGEAVIDADRAVDCLAAVSNLSCALTGPELTAARKACFEAIVGTRTAGQPCEGSIECAPGNFCDPDGGTCAPLRGLGGSCAIIGGGNDEVVSVRSEEACSWRGSGDTKLRCASYDFDTLSYLPRAQWKCAPLVDVDEGCNSTVWCKDSICDPFAGYYCASPVEIFTNLCSRVLD